MEELIQLLQSIAPMSLALVAHLQTIIKRREFPKRGVIVREGEICNSIFYIQSGLVRSYYRLGGRDISNWFMKEGDICISVLSFLRRIPSVDFLIAYEACVCYGITHEELEETYRLFPEFHNHGRIITGEYYCQSEERHIALKRQTPEDKYAQLMESDPGLIRRVNNKEMASFLNVGDRTYDNIRATYQATAKKRGPESLPGR